MPAPLIHFHSLKRKNYSACGLKWTPEKPEHLKTFTSDPDKVTCPKCIARFEQEGILDARGEDGD